MNVSEKSKPPVTYPASDSKRVPEAGDTLILYPDSIVIGIVTSTGRIPKEERIFGHLNFQFLNQRSRFVLYFNTSRSERLTQHEQHYERAKR